jgi:hypothetical protein
MLGLAGIVLGCSGGSAPPLTEEKKEANKKFAEDFKNAQKEFRAARGAAKGGLGGARP